MRVVFINGWSASEALLDKFKDFLPERVELMVLDDLYGLELDALFARIDQSLSTKTFLIGWSLGGMLALLYLSQIAKRNLDHTNILGSVLLNTSPCFLETKGWPEGVTRSDFEKLKFSVDNKKADDLVRMFGHLLVAGSDNFKNDRRFIKPRFNTASLSEWNVLLRGLEYLESLDLRSILSNIDLPVLSILGEEDALINRSVESFYLNASENYKLKIFQGMGHYPFGHYAEQVSENIMKFIDETIKV